MLLEKIRSFDLHPVVSHILGCVTTSSWYNSNTLLWPQYFPWFVVRFKLIQFSSAGGRGAEYFISGNCKLPTRGSSHLIVSFYAVCDHWWSLSKLFHPQALGHQLDVFRCGSEVMAMCQKKQFYLLEMYTEIFTGFSIM